MKKKDRHVILSVLLCALTLISYALISFGYDIYWGGALAGTYEYGLPLLFLGWIPLVIGVCMIPTIIVLLVMVIRLSLKKK